MPKMISLWTIVCDASPGVETFILLLETLWEISTLKSSLDSCNRNAQGTETQRCRILSQAATSEFESFYSSFETFRWRMADTIDSLHSLWIANLCYKHVLERLTVPNVEHVIATMLFSFSASLQHVHALCRMNHPDFLPLFQKMSELGMRLSHVVGGSSILKHGKVVGKSVLLASLMCFVVGGPTLAALGAAGAVGYYWKSQKTKVEVDAVSAAAKRLSECHSVSKLPGSLSPSVIECLSRVRLALHVLSFPA